MKNLNTSWEILEVAAGSVIDAKDLPKVPGVWRQAVVPGTVAQSLGVKFGDVKNLDSFDYWYRCGFEISPQDAKSAQVLTFEGLATHAQVWLNGEMILNAQNMFRSYDCDVDGKLKVGLKNELIIRFRSLDVELSQKKPRPKWRTALVSNQNLRFVRTTLLGRIPGWTPPIAPVGIYKPVFLAARSAIDGLNILASIIDGKPTVHIQGSAEKNIKIEKLYFSIGEKKYPLELNGSALVSNIQVSNAPLWWPHTHGRPNLLPYTLEAEVNGTQTVIRSGRLGFKTVDINQSNGLVEFAVNKKRIFCRGACWTTNDFFSLAGSAESLRQKLLLAKDAGMNMIRVGGTMTYESDEFYSLCDELGIMVWQDFMFANMDYPIADAEFKKEVTEEVKTQLSRLQKHASVSVYCGGSEVYQQAAMMGVSAGEWKSPLFEELLPELVKENHADVPYIASTPVGGALPFHVASGITHYYGVGAYLRPLSDVKSAKVKFTSETLGFSNVPERITQEEMIAGNTGAILPPHHPLSKSRVPRDNGAGWDFEDVRDHYTKELFKLDPIALRYADFERYYRISRVVTGEVMKSVFAEWRKAESVCGGGLVWFFNDLWTGAGWGIIDSLNRPKAVYHYLKRAWAPQAVFLTDEGLDGLALQVVNDSADKLIATVGFDIYNLGRIRTGGAEKTIEIDPNSAMSMNAEEMLGYFSDLTYSYKFGPPKHDVVRSYLKSPSGEVISEDFYFPNGLNLAMQDAPQIETKVDRVSEFEVSVKIKSSCFLQNVHFDIQGYNPADQYFHLSPSNEKEIRFKMIQGDSKPFKCELSALNIRDSITLRCEGK